MKDAETDQKPQPKRAEAPKYVPPHRRPIAENASVPSKNPSNPPRIGKRWNSNNYGRWVSGQKLTFAEEPAYYNNKPRPRPRNQPSQWNPNNTRHRTVPLEQGRFNAWHRSNHKNRFPYNFRSRIEHTYQGTNKFPILDLPWDIVLIILSKCSLKSILRFRCVSKDCCQMTKDPSFLDFHLENALSKPPCYILTKTCDYRSRHKMEALYLVEEGKGKWRTTKIGVGAQIEGKVQIVGSCRGLLCLCREDLLSEEAIFIYNPITREYMALPQINDKDLNVGRDYYGEFYGCISFGFDENSKKYKVTFISTSNEDAKGRVISLGETSWRSLQTLSSKFRFLKYIRDGRKSLFFNGCFYWIISKNDESGFVNCILVMDICQEKFAEIKFIDNYNEEDSHYLVDFGKSLALIAYHRGNADMKIWVLEDGSRGIWNCQP